MGMITNPSLSEKRKVVYGRKYTTHSFSLSEGEQVDWPWSQPIPFTEEEGMYMGMITIPSLSEKRKVVHGHDHRPPTSFVRRGTSCLAMVTAIPYPRRGRSVYGYDHQPFPFQDEGATHLLLSEEEVDIRPWSPSPLPFPEKEGVCMDMITTTPSLSQNGGHDHTIPYPRRGRSVYGYDR